MYMYMYMGGLISSKKGEGGVGIPKSPPTPARHDVGSSKKNVLPEVLVLLKYCMQI